MLSLSRLSIAAAAIIGLVVTSIERDARACGGCFHERATASPTVVSGHRMAFSISTTQTVLWDQIEYSGSPTDFAWVLPIHPGAMIELSRDEWFAALEASTRPISLPPPPQYFAASANGGGGGGGCGGDDDSASGFADESPSPPPPPVQVISQQVIGPYETATLRSTDPNALTAWLTQNNYDIPAAIEPTIGAYVSEGFDFIALRLRPGAGVQAMQPVRVVTPGADVSLPLRMIAAGAGAKVGLVLYVIGEGRYETENFPNAVVEDSLLTWSYAANASNYDVVAQSLMDGANGHTWLTEYAKEPDFSSVAARGNNPGLAYAYYSQCGATLPMCNTPLFGSGMDASTDATSDAADASGAPIDDASSDAAIEAGATKDAGTCGPPTAQCPTFDDLTLATNGLSAGNVWVTRLRAMLPVDALTSGDLRLQAAPQTAVSNVHQVSASGNAPSTIAKGSSCTNAPRSTSFGTGIVAAITALVVGRWLRRRR
jgi:hypothetical protein